MLGGVLGGVLGTFFRSGHFVYDKGFEMIKISLAFVF